MSCRGVDWAGVATGFPSAERETIQRKATAAQASGWTRANKIITGVFSVSRNPMSRQNIILAQKGG